MKLFPLSVALLLSASLSLNAASHNPKLSPALGLFIQQQSELPQVHRAPSHQMITALVKLTGEANASDIVGRYGGELLSTIGHIYIVRIPIYKIEAMAADDQVIRIEAERTPRPMLDSVPRQIGADKASANSGGQLPQAFTGQGVVVGIVDSGFDFIHPFFRNPKGITRVGWAADYISGKSYASAAEVTKAQHSSDASTIVHGTHVAGIAVGSRVNDVNDVFYQGIAPGADIAMGAVPSEITDEGLASAKSVQAFSDIFDYAEAQGKPCVINYSMGDALSFAHSRQLEEEAISTLLQKPGRALVVAAGNSGGTSRLAHKAAEAQEGGVGVMFNDYEHYGTYFGVELKVRQTQTIRLRHTNSSYYIANGEIEMSVDELCNTNGFSFAGERVQVYLREVTDDGYYIIYLTTGTNTMFTIYDRILVTVKGEGEAWLYADALCAQFENVPSVENHSLAQEGYSMTWPAELPEAIAVGNVAHRMKILTAVNKYMSSDSTDLTPYESTKGPGFLARSSSVGPTLTGAMKPDVCAPGVNVISALNNWINENTEMEYAAWLISHLDTDYEEGYGYSMTLAQTGTSMSAPAVAGTIALWMEADPTLTTDRIKDIIAHTSRHPDNTMAYPNQQYGYGEIDAYQGLLYLTGTDRIAGLSHHQPAEASFHLDGRLLAVQYVATQSQQTERQQTERQQTERQQTERQQTERQQTERQQTERPLLTVYDLNGRPVASAKATTIDLSRLPVGIYAVQLSTGCAATSGSTLIRLK